VALRAVYSVQLMALAPALPVNTVVVPDGSRLILRDVDATEQSGATDAVAYVANAASGVLWWLETTHQPIGTSFQWRGRQVFNPGESIVFHVLSGTWGIQMSGYQLTLT